MKLHLPCPLFRALMACLAAFAMPAMAASSTGQASWQAGGNRFCVPDVEQTGGMLCWAASAADILSLHTGQDAQAIYRSLTAATGNTPGHVATALSWYLAGAQGALQAAELRTGQVAVRQGFASLNAFAEALELALGQAGAASLSLYPLESGQGHALTIYGCEREGGRLFLSYADSADGVQGLRRAELVEHAGQLRLEGTAMAVGSLSFICEDAAANTPAQPLAPVGAILHSAPTVQEYMDIAQGVGIYRFGGEASLIYYSNGDPTYKLEHTPTYTAVCDMGYMTVVNNGSFQLTVAHNGMMNNESFSGHDVGGHAQRYCGVGVRYVDMFSSGQDIQHDNRDNPTLPTGTDYRVERLTRLVTDASSAVYCTDAEQLSNLTGVMSYRTGHGTPGYYDADGTKHYTDNWGTTAGISELTSSSSEGDTVYSYGYGFYGVDYEHCSAEAPLPAASAPGDSGSPVYIYNEKTQQFELVGFTQGGDESNTGTRYNPVATERTIDYLREEIHTGTGGETIYIEGAKAREGDQTLTGTSAEDGKTYTAILHKGTVTQGTTTLKTYNGIALDVFEGGTWSTMGEADYNKNTWYTYSDSQFINIDNNDSVATDADDLGMKDLFYTSSLQFLAESATQAIELKDNVDLGAGYLQFSLAEGLESATFSLGEHSSTKSLSASGIMVDAGVTLDNYLTYEAGRELRRVGEGRMNMVGEGDNNVLLNIGGSGLTHLNRSNGYAAYNVFVGSGATLRLENIGQVKRNVTLGAGGGTLDLNGNSYTWSAMEGVQEDGTFSLTVYEGGDRVETATIANLMADSVSTLTISRSGNFEFAGAFRDGSTYTGRDSIVLDSRHTMMPAELIGEYTQYTAEQLRTSSSALKVIYNGGGTMAMTGVYTLLAGSAGDARSGMEVASGKVQLQGTNTIHAVDYWGNRWFNADDWHFAMAEMDVQVERGATFELGHHAALIGDVNVSGGGSYVMKQAVNKAQEYVEGWYVAEDMELLADYYGHKGNVTLAEGALMDIRFDAGIATTLTYGGTISGEGTLTVNAAEGAVHLTGPDLAVKNLALEQGELHIDGITVSGTLDLGMGEGASLTIGSLHLAGGAVIQYSALDYNLTVNQFTHEGAYILNLDNVVMSVETADGSFRTLDLGMQMSDFTIRGLEPGLGLYTLGSNEAGHTTLTLTGAGVDALGYKAVEWDPNWQLAEGADPGRVWHTDAFAGGSLAGSTFDNGQRTAISVSGTVGKVDLYAAQGNSWVEVTGGEFGTIAGTQGGDVSGDIHLQLSGGTVNDVVGYASASGGKLTGNTYVSVYEGVEVRDSVIGGGVMANGAANVTGDTHVFIYGVLGESPETLEGTNIGARYNAVIGGLASGSASANGEWTLDGSTHVMVDLSAYTGESTNFVKSIYGGNMSSYQWGNIKGSTEVFIDANGSVTFTDNIVAGSRQNGSTGVVRIDGNSTLTINGGIFAGDGTYLTGGNWVEASEAEIKGQAAVILNGGTIKRDVYAAGISNDGATTDTSKLYVGSTLVQIGAGVRLDDGITVSGGFGGTTGRGKVNGNRTLSLGDGVNLASSSTVFKDFSHIEVDAGTATLNAAKLSGMNAFTKTGNGSLVLESASALTGQRTFTVEASNNPGAVELVVNAAIGSDADNGFKVYKEGTGTLELAGDNKFAWGFVLNEGRVIASSASALGKGAVDVLAGATLEIAKGVNVVNIPHRIAFSDASELRVHELSTELAALATSGVGIGQNDDKSSIGKMTLTLAEDVQLSTATGYKVISLGSNVASGTQADGVTVNYLGDGRYSFGTRYEDSTLYLDVTKDTEAATLVWDGSSESAVWNQATMNTNWNSTGDTATDTSFMNGDTVKFTDGADHRTVAVDAKGVQVASVEVSGEGYSFSGGQVMTAEAALKQEVSLHEGASFSLGEVYTISQNGEGEAATLSGLDLSATGKHIHGLDGHLARIDHALIDIAKGMTISMKDVLLTQHSRITDEPATLSVENVTIEIGEANARMEGSATLAAGTVLLGTGGQEGTTLTASATVCMVSGNALDTVTVTGSDLTLDLSSFADSFRSELAGYDYVAITFSSLEKSDSLAHFDTTQGLSISATFGNGLTGGVYVAEVEQTAASTLYISVPEGLGTVPEPTTVTLGLLALAALAARRRRAR